MMEDGWRKMRSIEQPTAKQKCFMNKDQILTEVTRNLVMRYYFAWSAVYGHWLKLSKQMVKTMLFCAIVPHSFFWNTSKIMLQSTLLPLFSESSSNNLTSNNCNTAFCVCILVLPPNCRLQLHRTSPR